MSYKDVSKQEGRKCENRTAEESFEVKMVEWDPTRRGYTPVPNYFKHYWTPLLGLKAAAVYEMICSFAHGDKDECHPTVGLLAATLGVDKHDLTGRMRRDRRPGHTAEYYQPGMFEVLESYNLLRITIEPGRWDKHRTFTILKYPPLLSIEQLAQLPKRVQDSHRRLLDRCRNDQEKFTQTSKRQAQSSLEKVPAIIDKTRQGGDGATQGGVTAPPTVGDGATGDLNNTNKTQTKQLSLSTPSIEEESVKNFYQQIGQPRISRQKVAVGVKTIADLQIQGFSIEEIVWAMTWITSHQEQFGGQVHSLGLLPQVISQAVQQRESAQKHEAKRQRQLEDERQLKEGIQRRQELEQLYQSLAPTEQETLRQVAVENLLSSGVEKRFLLEPIVRGEVCRLLEEQGQQQR